MDSLNRLVKASISLPVTCLILALLSACQTGPRTIAITAPGAIDELNLLTMPIGLNLDTVPGADGFAVKIFPSTAAAPKSVPIKDGTLEVLMYEGVIQIDDASSLPSPLQSWTFSPGQLIPFEQQSFVGTGYELTLRWGPQAPGQSKVTIVARYLPPHGAPPVYSAPNAITVMAE